MPSIMRVRKKRDGGFALVAVAIATAALSLMLAAVADAAHRNVNEARGGAERLKLSAAMDGALTTVAAQLTEDELAADIFTQPRSVAVGGMPVEVSVRPETSKIDLNAAPPDMLADLFRAIGLAPERARALADAVAEWRNASADRNFTGVSELARVPGADDRLVSCIAADVTVFTNVVNVNATYASSHVRAAFGLPTVAPPPPADQRDAVAGAGAIFELTARVTSADGPSLSRQLVLRLTGNPREPIWVLATGLPAPASEIRDAVCREFAAAANEGRVP